MKATVNIPDNDLPDAIRFNKAQTKRKAIVTDSTGRRRGCQ
jgi:hypothetical protein